MENVWRNCHVTVRLHAGGTIGARLADTLVDIYIAVPSVGNCTLLVIFFNVVVLAHTVGEAWGTGAYIRVVGHGRVRRAQVCDAAVGQLDDLREQPVDRRGTHQGCESLVAATLGVQAKAERRAETVPGCSAALPIV